GVAAGVGADRVLAVAPDLRRARLRPSGARLGARGAGAALSTDAGPVPHAAAAMNQRYPVKPGSACPGAYAASLSRSRPRPRGSRDMPGPTGVPMISAIPL